MKITHNKTWTDLNSKEHVVKVIKIYLPSEKRDMPRHTL